jgi:hypothetical protein
MAITPFSFSEINVSFEKNDRDVRKPVSGIPRVAT